MTKRNIIVALTLGVLLSLGVTPTASATPDVKFTYGYAGQTYQSRDYSSKPSCSETCALTAQSQATDSSGIAAVRWTLRRVEEPDSAARIVGQETNLSLSLSAGGYVLTLVARANDGTESQGLTGINVVAAEQAPQPLYFDGPTSVKAGTGLATLMAFRSPRAVLVGDWRSTSFIRQGSGDLEFVGRSGPGPDGLYRHLARIRYAPTGVPLEIQVSDERHRDRIEPWPQVTVIANTVPPINGLSARIVQGLWRSERGTFYRATGLISGFAARPYSCGGYLRLQWKVKTRWKTIRAANRSSCLGFPSYSKQFLTKEIRVVPATIRRLGRQHRLRLVFRPLLRSNGRIVFSRRAIYQAVRPSSTYREPTRP